MWKQWMPGLRFTLLMTVLTGLAYPFLVTGVCQLVFPRQANGSLMTRKGKLVGSELLAQAFTRAQYFQPRPSAAGNDGYDPTASGGSNLGPTSQKLADRVKSSVEQFRKDNPGHRGDVPADLLTASGSGLDPHLSPASAAAQAGRVAKARGVDEAAVLGLISAHTEGRDLGFLGEPRVNVLKLNLALDETYPAPR